MAKRPSAKSTNDSETPTRQIIDAALRLAAERRWSEVTLADIAGAAGLPLVQVYRLFPSKPAILDAFSRQVDAATLERTGNPDGERQRDLLFDTLMHRFDVLLPYKPGIIGLAKEFRRGRLDGIASLIGLARSMPWMLEASGISASGLKGMLRSKVLLAAYLSAMKAWFEDDSADQSRTMAALDRALRRAERLLDLDRTSSAPAGEATEA